LSFVVWDVFGWPALTAQSFERAEAFAGYGLKLSFAEKSARVHRNDAESMRHSGPSGREFYWMFQCPAMTIDI
jgi:hypothetical protein